MSDGSSRRLSAESLLRDYDGGTDMERLDSKELYGEGSSANRHTDYQRHHGRHKQEKHEQRDTTITEREDSLAVREGTPPLAELPKYRLYKRRFFGLAQLVLLNIVVYWDGLTFASVSGTSAQYFNVSQTAINWLSTVYLFAFVAASPFVLWTLNKHGPKTAIIVASVLILVGDWIRYGGARASEGIRFGTVMFGQILIGIAQPFLLCAPTRYSNLWFSDEGRVTATALASLANPLGGALGQLIAPLWATEPSKVPDLILWTCVLSTLAAVPSIFIPKQPPSPPSAIGAAEKLDLRQALPAIAKNMPFWLIFAAFSVYVGLFNATAALINQYFEPYGASETDAGIAGGILIIVGIISSVIVSPIVDRTKKYLLVIKMLVPLVAASFLILIFMPGTRTLAGPYVVCALLGASAFSLLPCALEYQALITHPISPEVTSTISWTGGQLLGAIFIIVEGQLKGGVAGEPPESMLRALIFQAVIALLVVPAPLLLGWWKFRPRETPLASTR